LINNLTYRGKALFIIAVFAIFAAVYNATLPIYIDEAYYWLWSKHLSLGYLDHPPMVAYMIKIFTLFGDAVWQIRMANIFCFFGAAIFVFKTAEYLFDEKTAFWAFLIFIFSPAVTMGLTITTPDSPLIFFWAASLYFASKAFFDGRTLDFVLAGALGGAALLSKYTGILLFFSYFLFIVFKKPRLFLSPKLYLAIFCGLVVFSPVIIWNIQNGFESFAFQYNHGTAKGAEPINFALNIEFFGGMFAVFGPVFFALLLFVFTKKEGYKNEKLFFVLLPALFTIVFFLYKGLYKKMELNWVAPAFLSASIVVGHLLTQKSMRKTAIIGLSLSLLIVFAARFPLTVGLTNAKNPHERLFGYEEVAARVAGLGSGEVFADHLTLASALSYHLKKDVYIPTSTRKSEFDRWQKGVNFAAKSGVYVSKDDRLAELRTIWKNVEPIEEFKAHKDGFRDKTFYIYRVSN
jgi:4-amino-4-deoxy-L-arabinose transferase-like glycosyltransferase